jgi:WD40 repeat protein
LVTVLGLQTLTGFPEEPQTKETETAGNERELATLRGHTGWVTGAAFSPDGQRLATCDSHATAKVWDLAIMWLVQCSVSTRAARTVLSR